MLPVLFALGALAGAPANVDLNDLDHFELQAEAFLDGPPGCWEVVGKAVWDWDFGRFGLSRGSAVFASTLDDGVWGDFHIEPMGETNRERKTLAETTTYRYEMRFSPLFGKLHEDIEVSNEPQPIELPAQLQRRDPKEEAREERQRERHEARRQRQRERRDDDFPDGPTNVLRWGLDRLSGNSAVTSWTQWDEEQRSVLLFRGVPIEDSANKEAEQIVRFPDGQMPDAMDVIFPDSWFAGTLPRVRVIDAEAHLRTRPSGSMLFPTRSAFKADMGVFGFRFSGAQSIAYKSFRPCQIEELGPELPEDPTAVPEEPLAIPVAPEEPSDAEPTE